MSNFQLNFTVDGQPVSVEADTITELLDSALNAGLPADALPGLCAKILECAESSGGHA